MCFVRTSPFRQDAQYSRSICVPLRLPTADTGELVSAAVAGLKSIFRPGFNYAKAGVMLLDLQSDSVCQGELDLGFCRIGGKAACSSMLSALTEKV